MQDECLRCIYEYLQAWKAMGTGGGGLSEGQRGEMGRQGQRLGGDGCASGDNFLVYFWGQLFGVLLGTTFWCTFGDNFLVYFWGQKFLALPMPVTREYISERTETEERALEYAVELGLLSLAERDCEECGARMAMEKREARRSVGKRWRCSARGCGRTKGIFDGTIFGGTHLSQRQAFGLMYGYCEKMRYDEMQEEHRVSRRTVARWSRMLELFDCGHGTDTAV